MSTEITIERLKEIGFSPEDSDPDCNIYRIFIGLKELMYQDTDRQDKFWWGYIDDGYSFEDRPVQLNTLEEVQGFLNEKNSEHLLKISKPPELNPDGWKLPNEEDE